MKYLISCLIIIVFVGCLRLTSKKGIFEVKQISYAELYADSVYLSCDGNMWIPEDQEKNWDIYFLAHQRMHRHLEIDSLLHWNFSPEDVKVSKNIYDFVTDCWKQENEQLKTGKFKIVKIGECNYDIQYK